MPLNRQNKITVPPAMIHATMKLFGWHPDRYSAHTGAFFEGVSVHDILEAALTWQAENTDYGAPGVIVATPPNPDFLIIARLFLENYSTLESEDRKLYRGLIWMMANPPMIMATDGGLTFMKRDERSLEAVKDLLYDPKDGPTKVSRNNAVIEAFKRGQVYAAELNRLGKKEVNNATPK